jgi:hypothetical protein
MRPGEVVEAFPLAQFGFEIDIILVGQELVEFLLIGPMRAFDFAVELRRCRFVCVPDALVLDMPVEFGLEFVAVIRPNFTDAERELFNDIVDEVDGIGLGMAGVYLECPDAGRIIDGGVLVTPDVFTLSADEVRNLTSTWIWWPGTCLL